MAERPRVLNIRMTDAEMEMVRSIAEHMGLTQSDAVRQVVRQAFAELPDAKPRKRKR